MSGGELSLSVPSIVRKMIENIKEMTGGNHSEEDIFAMLIECSMDPNETAQQLVLRDSFREVKKKREKKQENANNKDSSESCSKNGAQGREFHDARVTIPPRSKSHNTVGSLNSRSRKESKINQILEKKTSPSLPSSKEIKGKGKIAVESSSRVSSTGPTGSDTGAGMTSTSVGICNMGNEFPPLDKKAFRTWDSKPTVSVMGIVGANESSKVPAVIAETTNQSQAVSSVLKLEDAISELQIQPAILSENIQIPEPEKPELSFGIPDVSSIPVSVTSQEVEKASSDQIALTTAKEGDYSDRPQSPIHEPESSCSGEGDVSSTENQGYDDQKETALPSNGHQYSVGHTSPTASSSGSICPMLQQNSPRNHQNQYYPGTYIVAAPNYIGVAVPAILSSESPQEDGMPMSYYYPIYYANGQYYAPYYVYPTSTHQYYDNNAYAQQPQNEDSFYQPYPYGQHPTFALQDVAAEYVHQPHSMRGAAPHMVRPAGDAYQRHHSHNNWRNNYGSRGRGRGRGFS